VSEFPKTWFVLTIQLRGTITTSELLFQV